MKHRLEKIGEKNMIILDKFFFFGKRWWILKSRDFSIQWWRTWHKCWCDCTEPSQQDLGSGNSPSSWGQLLSKDESNNQGYHVISWRMALTKNRSRVESWIRRQRDSTSKQGQSDFRHRSHTIGVWVSVNNAANAALKTATIGISVERERHLSGRDAKTSAESDQVHDRLSSRAITKFKHSNLRADYSQLVIKRLSDSYGNGVAVESITVLWERDEFVVVEASLQPHHPGVKHVELETVVDVDVVFVVVDLSRQPHQPGVRQVVVVAVVNCVEEAVFVELVVAFVPLPSKNDHSEQSLQLTSCVHTGTES